MSDPRPIALIDSGLGGLTVARALSALLPQEQLLYFADTARSPYGSRSPERVTAMIRQIVRHLADFQPKHYLLACHTATALALPAIRAEFSDLSVSGVIEPTARAAVEAAGGKPVPLFGVLATEATIRSRAYERALARRRNRSMVLLRPAPLLAPMIEEGRDSADSLLKMAVGQYVQPLVARKVDVVVLGCTHFPLISRAIEQAVGQGIPVVDASARCAEDVARRLRSAGKLKLGGAGSLRCLVTDDPIRFRQIAAKIAQMPMDAPELIRCDDLPDDRPIAIRAAG